MTDNVLLSFLLASPCNCALPISWSSWKAHYSLIRNKPTGTLYLSALTVTCLACFDCHCPEHHRGPPATPQIFAWLASCHCPEPRREQPATHQIFAWLVSTAPGRLQSWFTCIWLTEDTMAITWAQSAQNWTLFAYWTSRVVVEVIVALYIVTETWMQPPVVHHGRFLDIVFSKSKSIWYFIWLPKASDWKTVWADFYNMCLSFAMVTFYK